MRDLMLVKIRTGVEQREEIKRTVDIFRGQIVDVGPEIYIVQIVGTGDKLDSFISAIGYAEVLEVARSGVAGISRGDKILSV